MGHYTVDFWNLAIKARYPNIKDFHIDHDDHNVLGIPYDEGYNSRIEYPPVAKWRVGNTKYRYVLDPKFRVEDQSSFLFRSTTVRADYTDEESIIWLVLECSSRGMSTEDTNKQIQLARQRQASERY